MIGLLHSEMTRLLHKFLRKFVSTTVIKAMEDLTEIDFKSPTNQHSNEYIAVGMKARSFLAENSDIPSEKISSFFKHVRSFYEEVTTKLIHKFPFKNQTLKTLVFINLEHRNRVYAQCVVEFAQRFGVTDADKLADQYIEYQLCSMNELDNFNNATTRFDSFLLNMEKKTLFNGNKQFDILAKVALYALSLPHSNADAERSFSMLRKIQQDCRGNLSHKTTTSLMTIKMNNDCECFRYSPTAEILKKAKTACTDYKQQTAVEL